MNSVLTIFDARTILESVGSYFLYQYHAWTQILNFVPYNMIRFLRLGVFVILMYSDREVCQ